MYIFGLNSLEAAKKNNIKIKKIWTNRTEDVAYIKGVEIFPLADFKERLHNSQGVVAEVEDYKYLSVNELLEKAKGKHIFITDKVTDPQNLGAIIRSIAAFGHGGLIIPKHEQVGINGTVIKTSAGTAFTVDIAESNSLIQLVKKLKDSGYWVVSTEMAGDISLDKLADMDLQLAIILGSEGKGVSQKLSENADFKLSIKMTDKVESLNVSATAAIISHNLMKK